MKTLVIVESPTKAKTIGKFLGKNYTVKSSMGHVRDLPKSDLGVDIEHEFEPKYITIRGKGELLKSLKEAAKKADKVLLASDPDREGEAIAWHLKEYLGYPEKDCRIEFNEITKDAVSNAVKHPRPIDESRVEAQQARRILDRLVGYQISPLLWDKVKKGLSAGRVQSVAVRMIVDREEEIEAFIPEEYWSLQADLQGENGNINAKLAKIGGKKADIKNQEEMDKILAGLQGKDYVVSSVQKKDKSRHPVPPFTTSSLQQEAARKIGFTAKKTMQIAQQLYEGIDVGTGGAVGLITYMRTDSVRVSAEAKAMVRKFIAAKFGPDYVPEKPNFYSKKGKIQDAHEAVRPSSVDRTPAAVRPYLSAAQYKLYKLIWERFVASQMKDAIMEQTTIDVTAGTYLFRATGSVLKFPGFMQVYIEGRDGDSSDEEGLLPVINEGEILKLLKLDPKQHFTQPPPFYNEATLVKALEERGIGRPSTYASIIDTILARGYVVREEKMFHPTELGKIIVDLLKEYFAQIMDVEFTAAMESNLDKVEEGSVEWRRLLTDFYGPFAEMLEHAKKEMTKVVIMPEESGEICEKCGRPMVYKISKFGKFLACSGFPECRNTKPIIKETGIPCLACGGQIVERKSRSGKLFYGCNNYPECDFVSWDKPILEKCPVCGTQMVEKKFRTGGKSILCPNKDCPTKEQEGKDGKGAKKPARKRTTTSKKSTTAKATKTTKKTTAKTATATTAKKTTTRKKKDAE